MPVWQPHTSTVRGYGILEGVFGISLLFYLMVTFSNPQNHSGVPKRKIIPGRPQCPGVEHEHTKKKKTEEEEDEGTTARDRLDQPGKSTFILKYWYSETSSTLLRRHRDFTQDF